MEPEIFRYRMNHEERVELIDRFVEKQEKSRNNPKISKPKGL